MKKKLTKFDLSLVIVFLSVFIAMTSNDINAQRRQRPGSIKNTNEYLEKATTEQPVTCKYIKNGASFKSNVYYYDNTGSARIEMGTGTLTLSNGHYTLNFVASKMKTQRVLTKQDKNLYNPWRMEKIANDFVQKGKFETFKLNGKYYLRLYDGDTNNYISQILLQSLDQKDFVMAEDGLSFEFTYR